MAASGGDLEGQWSLLTAALYGILSFSVVLAAALLILLACRKKYSLNWFEKNLLESAKAKETSQSDHEALMTGGEESGSVAGCSDCEQGDNKFWVPPALLPRSTSSVIPAHEASAALAVDPILATTPTADDVTDLSSGPQTPKTPLSISSGGENSPGYRPRLSSMQTRLDHTKIDTTLYQKQKEAEEATAGPSLGAVHLSLMYDPPAGILSVRLLEAQDLRARDFSGTADPYAKIRLLPDRNNVWQTRIHKKTLNPDGGHPRLLTGFPNLRELHLTGAFAKEGAKQGGEKSLGLDQLSSLREIFRAANLTQLVKLHLEQNRISTPLPKDIFCSLTSLLDLHLGDNWLTPDSLPQLTCLPKLRFIDLGRNHFTYISARTMEELDTMQKRPTQNLTIEFGKNPLDCDHFCSGNFAIWLRDTNVTIRNKDALKCVSDNSYHCSELSNENRSAGGHEAAAIILGVLLAILIIMLAVATYLNRTSLSYKLNPIVDSVSRKVRYTSIDHPEEQEMNV